MTRKSTVHTHVSAYLPTPAHEDRPGPGRPAVVDLEVVSRGPAELVLPEATIRDVRGLPLVEPGAEGDLLADPGHGGAPLRSARERLDAARFGLTNVAYHVQQALRTAEALLGAPLPHLVVLVGAHDDPRRRWGGGHYRVAAQRYDPPEDRAVSPTGEVHLGSGSKFLPGSDGEPYFGAPSHNLAIIHHEVGHHVCRHTADFRLNGARPKTAQRNKKIALDEGTADVFTAIMLDTADIYGWHRSGLPIWDRRRRALSPARTMAGFDGGSADPHADGTIWASACWSARQHVVAAGEESSRFDRMLLRGLVALNDVLPAGIEDDDDADREVLKRRRYYGNLLDAMLRVAPDLDDPVRTAMRAHGIEPGHSNAALRDIALGTPVGELRPAAPAR